MNDDIDLVLEVGLIFPCRACGAKPGTPCKTPRVYLVMHSNRVDNAKALLTHADWQNEYEARRTPPTDGGIEENWPRHPNGKRMSWKDLTRLPKRKVSKTDRLAGEIAEAVHPANIKGHARFRTGK